MAAPTARFGVIFDEDGNVLDAGPARKADKGYTIDTDAAQRSKTIDLKNVKRISTTELYIFTESPERYCYYTSMGWKCVG